MAMQDKVTLMTKVEDTLKPRMFANLLEEAIDEISGHLQHFDVRYEAGDDVHADDLLDAFIKAKRTEGKSEKTLFQYNYAISRFVDYCGVPPSEINANHVRDYFSREQLRGIADSTIEGTRQKLSAFFGWCESEKLIRSNPMRNVGRIKCMKKVREAFSETDLERLNRACADVRDHAIVLFLMSSGCRIIEMCGLNRNDVDLDTGEYVVLGKGNKQRTVYISAVAAMVIREYLATRKDNLEPLFTSRKLRRFTPNGVRAMLRRISEAAGVENVHPHRFRRTLITTLLNRGMALQEVAILAGHDKMDTTMRYFASDNTHIKNSYKRFSY